MSHQNVAKNLAVKTDSKIVFIVLDGIGGHPLTDCPRMFSVKMMKFFEKLFNPLSDRS